MSKLQGPRERFAPVAVFGGALGTMWRVYDRKTSRYVNTLPQRFYARESALLSAWNLNRGYGPPVEKVDAIVGRTV